MIEIVAMPAGFLESVAELEEERSRVLLPAKVRRRRIRGEAHALLQMSSEGIASFNPLAILTVGALTGAHQVSPKRAR